MRAGRVKYFPNCCENLQRYSVPFSGCVLHLCAYGVDAPETFAIHQTKDIMLSVFGAHTICFV